jgi:hypothetical protein
VEKQTSVLFVERSKYLKEEKQNEAVMAGSMAA